MLSRRLRRRKTVRGVRRQSNQVLAVRLWRAVVGAERLGIIHVHARKIHKELLNPFS